MELTKRKNSDPKFFWAINDLFADDDAWQKEFDDVLKLTNSFEEFEGHLSDMKTLFKCLCLREELNEKIGRVYVYAVMKFHEDSTVSKYQGMSDKSDGLITKLMSATAFIEPSILENDKQTIFDYIENSNDEKIKIYKHHFEDLFRLKDHVLSADMEQLLAAGNDMAASAENTYAMLHDADLKFGTVKNEDGEEVTLSHGRFISLLESKNVNVRKEAFKTYYKSFIDLQNTFASIYSSSVKKDVYYASARKFSSSLDAALSQYNIPSSVYTNLVEEVNKYLPQMHRYIALRKKILKIDELHMYDIYTPIVAKADTKVSFEEAKKTVLKALEPMGKEYTDQVINAFKSGWIDVYENSGKRSGAYSWGAYGCHPYVLLNFDGKVNDMFTLIHEMGHAMHSHYTWNNEPYLYSGHTIFVAEVASTVNEALLMEYLLKTTTDKTFSMYLLNYFLEQFRGTLFRQTMFAEFEMISHDMAEKGIPLNSETLSETYSKLNKKYYGDGIIQDDEIKYEWSRIPHFYNAFYVYQYATGYSAAIALSRKILDEGSSAVDAYTNFLKSGNSMYSIDLLKMAGVNMSKTKPITDALEKFTSLLDEMEKYF